jgi:pimeloyl-ACP methyl ester carboxylesterase
MVSATYDENIMPRLRTFVLVHGMSHGGWAWGALAARLERAGHRVIAPDLPGHGRRAHERARATVDRYAAAVADAMMLHGAHDAVVVGHSMGGVVIPKVAERVPARVRHLVFLAAVVLPHGGSLIETQMAPPSRALLRGLARSGAGAVQYPASIEWARWMSDLAPGDARVVDALARLTPQPFTPWAERADMRRFFALRMPCTYIRCLRDQAVTPARAAEYAARLGVTPIDMDCAHNPMLSAPAALAKILESV